MSTTQNKAVLTMENGRIMATTTVNGVHNSKTISPDSLSRLIQQQTALTTPLLPGSNGVKLYSRKESLEYIAYVTPPKMRTIIHEDSTIVAPTPRLIWFVCIDNSRGNSPYIRDTELFALQNEVLTADDILYRAPFPNVYSSHGICWEGNLQENIRSVNAAGSVESQFFAAKFNNDLDDHRVQGDYGEHGDGSSLSLYRELEEDGATEFPSSELIAAENGNLSLTSAFEAFMRKQH